MSVRRVVGMWMTRIYLRSMVSLVRVIEDFLEQSESFAGDFPKEELHR